MGLLEDIKSEFNLPAPPDEPISVQRSEEVHEDTAIFWGKNWEDITLKDFDDNMYVFTSLPKSALPYFLGAYMYKSLQENKFSNQAFDFVSEHPILMKNKKYKRRPKMLVFKNSLSVSQVRVFISYLEYCANVLKGEEAEIMNFMKLNMES